MPAPTSPTTAVPLPPPGALSDNDFALAVMLYLAYSDAGTPRAAPRADTALFLTEGLRAAVERHLAGARRPLRFADAAALKAFADVKRDEAAALRAVREVLPAAEVYYHAVAGEVFAKQQRERQEGRGEGTKAGEKGGGAGSGSTTTTTAAAERTARGPGGEIAKTNLRLVRHAAGVLPGVIARTEAVEKGLRERLGVVRRKKRELGRAAEWRALQEREATLEAWLGAVVPSSEVYARLEEERRAADEKLAVFRREHPAVVGRTAAEEARLRGEYEELLVYVMQPETGPDSGGEGDGGERVGGGDKDRGQEEDVAERVEESGPDAGA